MNDEQTLPPSSSLAARTHVGRRSNNEDRVLVDESLGLFIVADGVGGHHAGEVASRITCEVVRECLADGDGLEAAVREANAAIHDAVRSGDGREGMASTIVALRVAGGRAECAWVGDSRAYLWDGTQLSLLTQDHSLVASLLSRGEISFDEAATHPQRNVILQALGQSPEHALEVGLRQLEHLPSGALLLLCSDGLSDIVDAPALVALLRDGGDGDLGLLGDALVDAALDGDGRDNISVALCRLPAGPGDDAGLPLSDTVWQYRADTGAYAFNRDGDTTRDVDPAAITRRPGDGDGLAETQLGLSPEPPAGPEPQENPAEEKIGMAPILRVLVLLGALLALLVWTLER